MNCCINDLGSYPHNEDIDIYIPASQAGEYIFVLFFNGVRIKRSVTFEYYDALVIPKPFNEDYTYTLQIIQPDGELLTVNDCENFSFKTYINIDRACGSDCPE